jgi:hypothetical protein
MPRVLTVTQKPDESTEQFAARIAEQAQTFFGSSPKDEPESTEPAPAENGETSPAPTDDTAPSSQGEEAD